MATSKTGKALFEEMLSQQNASSVPADAPAPTSGKALFDSVLQQQSTAPTTPTAPSEEVDEGLVNKIMTTSNVDRGEAVRRARNTAALLKQPNRPTLAQGRTLQEEYGDIPSTLGAIVEGGMQAIPWLGPFLPTLEGNLGDVLESEYGLLDNPFTSGNIRRRREASPILAGGAELAGIGATIAGGLAKAVKPELFYSQTATGKALRAAETLDLPGKVASKMSAKAGAKTLGSTFEKETGLVAEDLAALERRVSDEGVGTLTQGEQEILDLYKKAKRVRTQDIIEAKVRRGDITAEEVATQRALEDRTKFVIQKKLDDSFKALGYEAEEAAQLASEAAETASFTGKRADVIGARLAKENAERLAKEATKAKVKTFAERAIRVGGIPAATVSGISAATTSAARELTESKTITREEVDAMGESAAADMLKDTLYGTGVGFLFGAGSPYVAKGFELATGGVRTALEKVSKAIIPKIGEAKTGIDASRFGAAMDAADYLAETDVKSEINKLVNALQFQYDEAAPYAERLKGLRQMLAHTARNDLDMHLEEGLARDGLMAQPLAPNLEQKLGDIRSKFMTYDNGKWTYSKNKLMDWFKDKPLNFRRTRTGTEANIALPEEIVALQDDMSSWQETLIYQNLRYANTGQRTYAYNDFLDEMNDLLPVPPNRYGRVDIRGQEKSGIAPIYNQAPEYPIAPGFENRQTMAPLQIPEGATDVIVKQKLKEFAGSKLDQPFGAKEAAQLLVPTIILQEFGLDLLPAGAAAYLGKKALDLLNDPRRSIEAYQLAQRFLFKSQEASRNLSRVLTTGGQVAGVASSALRQVSDKEKEKNPFSLNENDTLRLYDADKKFLAKFESDNTLDQMQSLYGENFDKLDKAFPNVGLSAGQTLPRQIAFLNEKFKATQPKNWDVVTQGQYTPTKQQLYTYALYSRYVRDPDTIYTDIEKKKYVPEQAYEVLQKVYPARLNQLRLQLLEEISTSTHKPDRTQQNIIAKILGKNPYGMSREDVQALQKSFEKETPPAGSGGPVSNRRVELEREGTSQQ